MAKSSRNRKREHDARQRKLGRAPRTYWLTDHEDKEVRALIDALRQGSGTAPAGNGSDA